MRNSYMLFVSLLFVWKMSGKGEISLTYTDFNAHDLVLVKEWEVKRSYIAIVKDARGKKYIIKQSKKDDVKGEMFCVREVAGAYLAKILGIPANEVLLIPAGVSVVGKKNKNRAATMHTFVEGIHWGVKKFEGSRFFSLRQRLSRAPSDAEKGLTLIVIKSMALHATLPLIVALDSFLGISGRNKRNLIYDESHDAFYVIDFDTGCTNNLCVWAIERLTEIMKSQDKVLEKQDIEGLILYKKMLEKIIHTISPAFVHTLLYDALVQAHIRDAGEAKKCVARYEDALTHSYGCIKKLIDVVKNVLMAYNKKIGFYHS